MKPFTVSALSIILISCASNPDRIDATYVSPLKYADYDCQQIGQEMSYVGQRTNELYQRLKRERNADNWQLGLGLVIFWPTLFALEGGDGPEATEYAQLQGDFEALRVNSVEKRCNLNYQSPEQVMEQAAQADDEQAGTAERPISERLTELDDLLNDGVISQEEYDKARERALGI